MTARVTAPRCPACDRIVRPHQTEIVLTDLRSGRRRTYHVAKRCARDAAIVLHRPGAVHHWAVRVPDGSAN